MTRDDRQRPGPFTLGAGQWLLVVAGLGVVLLFYVLMALPGWRATHLTTVRAPQLQRCLGFTAAPRTLAGDHEDVLTITALDPNSALAVAGIRVDDVPIGYKHGTETGFYADLENVVAGHDVVVRVVARLDWQQGSSAWRPVRIEGRRITCN